MGRAARPQGKSGTQPTPGLTATLRGRAALCAYPHTAHLFGQLVNGLSNQGPEQPSFWCQQHSGQGSSAHTQGGGPRACRSGQPASQCDVHSDARFSTEEDVNLQGEAAKFPMGSYVCEAERPVLAAHIYQITIDHCLPIFKGKMTLLWLAYHDQASFGKQNSSPLFILSSLFFYLGSERLSLYLESFSSKDNSEIKNDYSYALGTKAFNIEKILWVLCRRQQKILVGKIPVK